MRLNFCNLHKIARISKFLIETFLGPYVYTLIKCPVRAGLIHVPERKMPTKDAWLGLLPSSLKKTDEFEIRMQFKTRSNQGFDTIIEMREIVRISDYM